MDKNLSLALAATVLSFCTLYTPQPILPLLSAEFGVSAADSALLVTLTLAPLGLAPIVYGYFLQAIPARTMLRGAVLLLILDQLAFFFATAFWHLLALRFLQGLLLPAIFTALMTYCATMARPGEVRRAMGWYIGATVLGGFLSRVLSGALVEWVGWQWMFVCMGLALVPLWVALRYTDADAEINFQRLDLRSIRRVLSDPLYRHCYLVLFSAFLVFSGVLNLLPFRSSDIDPAIGPFGISLAYTGYLVCVPIAILSERMIRAIGGVRRALLTGLGVNFIGLAAYLLPNIPALFATMFIFAAGMFSIHAALSGLVNERATEHKGVVNGLYVSVYYLSGALGSWLPGYVYQYSGWTTFLYLSALLLATAALFAGKIRA
ncbi:MAG: MFS transporter [Gammaproteobacteria bacterium]|nr:MFS transporter [Gammaproteobacteria bacterium]